MQDTLEQFKVTEEELAQRDPIILSKREDFELPAAGKSLMRLGPMTCPTPSGPVDEKIIITFTRF